MRSIQGSFSLENAEGQVNYSDDAGHRSHLLCTGRLLKKPFGSSFRKRQHLCDILHLEGVIKMGPSKSSCSL